MSRLGELLPDGGNGFPRVSGDEPTWNSLSKLRIWFSPRERG